MSTTRNRHERSNRPTTTMVESLENRALMSATTAGFCDGSVRTELPAVQQTLLPAVQKVSSPQTTNGIIAVLIGL
jgi:hypothetical protein